MQESIPIIQDEVFPQVNPLMGGTYTPRINTGSFRYQGPSEKAEFESREHLSKHPSQFVSAQYTPVPL